MTELEKAFETHIYNRASAAALGALPNNAKETLAVATANDVETLMKAFSSTQAENKKLKAEKETRNKA